MVGLASLTARRRSASVVATAMCQVGGGSRLRGFESRAKMGASGLRSPSRPSFTPSGGKRGYSSSGVPTNKTDLDKLDEIHKIVTGRGQQSSFPVKVLQGASVVVLGFGLAQLAYGFGAKSSEEISRFAKAKIHELSRDEGVLNYVDLVVKRETNSFLQSVNPVSSVMERWSNWGAGKIADVQAKVESEWVASAINVAILLQRLDKLGMEFKEEAVIHLIIGFLGYNQERSIELLGNLVSIGFVERRASTKGEGNVLKMSRSNAKADLLADKDFLNKLMEAEKMNAKK